jgi:hypothetical protein
MSMKPTQEQIEHLKVWLDARLSALFAGRPFPPIPFPIECTIQVSPASTGDRIATF